MPPIPQQILTQDKTKQFTGNVLQSAANGKNGKLQRKVSINLFENVPIKWCDQSNKFNDGPGQKQRAAEAGAGEQEPMVYSQNLRIKKETTMKSVSRIVLNQNIPSRFIESKHRNDAENVGEQQQANRKTLMKSQSQSNVQKQDATASKPPIHPETAESQAFHRDMVAIRQHIQYVDGRVIVSAEGDRSTFDDFDWGMDITNMSGLGSSFSQRVLIQEDRLKKQIKQYFNFYLNVVGGWDQVNQVLFEKEL